MYGLWIIWVLAVSGIVSGIAYFSYKALEERIPETTNTVYTCIGIALLAGLVYLGSRYSPEYSLGDFTFFVIIIAMVVAAIFYLARRGKYMADRGDLILLNEELEAKADAEKTGEHVDDFHDEELDSLISRGKFKEARKRLFDIIKVAAEMNDDKAIKNYQKYKQLLDEAFDDYR
jgi:hypothetical protein